MWISRVIRQDWKLTSDWEEWAEKSKEKVFTNVLLFINSFGVLIMQTFTLAVWELWDVDFMYFLSFYSHL